MTTTVELTRAQLREAMTVTVQEGESGDVRIKRFTVSEQDAQFANMRMMLSYGGGRGRDIKPGTYTALYRNGKLWMSDTPAERSDHVDFVKLVSNMQLKHVLVTGLGIGMVAQALAMIPSVETVTVVELDPDVCGLVGPHLRNLYHDRDKAFFLVQGDAKDPATLFPKSVKVHFDAAWHDIWQDIRGDNWENMKVMRRKWRSRCEYQAFWCEDEVKRLAREDRAYSRTYGGF